MYEEEYGAVITLLPIISSEHIEPMALVLTIREVTHNLDFRLGLRGVQLQIF
jgi:hypothetical protein